MYSKNEEYIRPVKHHQLGKYYDHPTSDQQTMEFM